MGKVPTPFTFGGKFHLQMHMQRGLLNQYCPVLPFCSTVYMNYESYNTNSSCYPFNRNKDRKTWRLTIAPDAIHDQRALGYRSISNGLFIWHPRNQYTLGHQRTIRFQIVKIMSLFIKESCLLFNYLDYCRICLEVNISFAEKRDFFPTTPNVSFLH